MKNFSKQRNLILDILKNSKSHPTAEEIFEIAKEELPNISLGTVYRNLDVLVSEKIIIKIPNNTKKDRFDYIHKNHSHAVCDNCGKIYDFNTSLDLDKLKAEVLKQTKLEADSNEILITGICKECQDRSKHEKS